MEGRAFDLEITLDYVFYWINIEYYPVCFPPRPFSPSFSAPRLLPLLSPSYCTNECVPYTIIQCAVRCARRLHHETWPCSEVLEAAVLLFEGWPCSVRDR